MAARIKVDFALEQTKQKASLLRRVVRRLRRMPVSADSAIGDVAAIKASLQFDKRWYLDQYPDVAAAGIDPVEHYVRYGVAEGRNPRVDFDTRYYLRENPDVATSGMNPFRHYVEHGAREGRPAVPQAKRWITVGPLVSVIIPIYAVEEYLAECLDSVVGQTYRNLEVIIVDDGSPDRSYDIANTYAQSDSRLRILRRENGGLGAARNAGIAAATGRYLSFVDSDDTLPADAVAIMVKSLQRTGSDFVVGAMRRLRHGKLMSTDGWVKEVHAEDRPRLRLTDFPAILTDVFACNKLFDADFFRKEVRAFPEKIRYEDQETTARAYLRGKFDVLAGIVYHWRVREDGTSITQKKSDPDDLRDRLIVKRRVSRILAEADAATYGTWLAKAVGFDLRPYFEQIPRTDLGFFQQLREGILALAGQMTPQLWQQVRMIDRLPALAVLHGYRDDVGIAITRRAEYGYFVPTRLENGAAYLDRKYLEDMTLSPDDALLKLGAADLSVVATATSLWWRGRRLHLEGFAYLTNLDLDDNARISAKLVSEGRPPIAVDLQQRSCPRVDWETKDAWNSHARSGFAIEIDPSELLLQTDAVWRIEITIGCSELSDIHSAILRDADIRGILGTTAVSALHGDSRWIADFEPGFGFRLQCHISSGVVVSAVDTDGGSVAITIDKCAAGALSLQCATLGSHIEVSGTSNPAERDRTVFRFALPELAGGDNREHLWQMRLCGDGEPKKLIYPGNVDDLERESPEYRRVRAVTSRNGTLRLAQNCWWAVADEVSVGPDAILIRGRIDAPGASAISARLVGETQALESDRVVYDAAAERFEARIPFDPAISAVEESASSRTHLPSGKPKEGFTDQGDSKPQELLQPSLTACAPK